MYVECQINRWSNDHKALLVKPSLEWLMTNHRFDILHQKFERSISQHAIEKNNLRLLWLKRIVLLKSSIFMKTKTNWEI